MNIAGNPFAVSSRKSGGIFRPTSWAALAWTVLWAGLAGGTSAAQAKPWDIRVVVLTTYEIGEDRGDQAGELQPWVEGENLREKLAFPAGVHDLYLDRQHHTLYIDTGTTTAVATASVMALGMDGRFDLSKAYWVVAGISGFNEQAASVGSVAWADRVFTDISKFIDPREAPADWPYGFYMMNAERPGQYILQGGATPDASLDHPTCYTLNPTLVAWAYELTHNVPLTDSSALAVERGNRSAIAAKLPPSVLIGGDFAGNIFWHGHIMSQYARDWVKLLSEGRSTFVASDMEDAGIVEALARLDRIKRADSSRLLIARSASNYTEPTTDRTAADSANGSFSGEAEGLENVYRIASKVVHELVNNWPKYRNGIKDPH